MHTKQVFVGSDHAGFELKERLKKMVHLEWVDLGCYSNEPIDYPDVAEKMVLKIQNTSSVGILICGTGIGMSIAANRFLGVRAASVENPLSAKLSKEHNNSNILCLGGRIVAPEYAAEIVLAWLEAIFCSQPTYQIRIDKIDLLMNS